MSEHPHKTSIPFQKNKSALLIVICLTLSVMTAEIIGSLLSGSLALLSDAAHMFTDTGALLLALFALWFSRRPATSEKTYGYYRIEILSALFNGAFLVFISGYIFLEAYKRILNPQPIEGPLMLVVACIGLLANLSGAYILSRSSRENLNMRGAFWHVISDAISSVGVIAGGVIITFTGLSIVDPIIGFVIAILILRGALSLVFESVDILLESTPRDIKLKEVIKDIKDIEGIKDFHDLHIWTITSGLRALSAHVLIDDAMLSKCEEISRQIKRLLKEKFSIDHATLEFECDKCPPGHMCSIKEK
ncbi:MAG: cation diffusion facilitator family transporter [Candidatus Margulisbacteria bacterium]|nr:cation diffusion facilitator family transporter [Candidatus Margulisiibacteriota bacterium]